MGFAQDSASEVLCRKSGPPHPTPPRTHPRAWPRQHGAGIDAGHLRSYFFVLANPGFLSPASLVASAMPSCRAGCERGWRASKSTPPCKLYGHCTWPVCVCTGARGGLGTGNVDTA